MTIVAVTPGSEAERTGLQVGNTVLEINAKTAGQESTQEMSLLTPGDTVTVKIRVRRGVERELKWKVGSREEISYELKDMENITAAQQARRAAWLRGEAQITRDAHSR